MYIDQCLANNIASMMKKKKFSFKIIQDLRLGALLEM